MTLGIVSKIAHDEGKLYAKYDDVAVSTRAMPFSEACKIKIAGYRLATIREILAVKDMNETVRFLLSNNRILAADGGVSAIGPCKIMSDGRLNEIDDESFYNLKGSKRAFAKPGTGSVILEWKPASNRFEVSAVPDASINGIAIWLPCANGSIINLVRK